METNENIITVLKSQQHNNPEVEIRHFCFFVSIVLVECQQTTQTDLHHISGISHKKSVVAQQKKGDVIYVPIYI